MISKLIEYELRGSLLRAETWEDLIKERIKIRKLYGRKNVERVIEDMRERR